MIPFFSIITVCFNAEKEIEITIRSILNQQFKNFEYIIIDGGSTDNTVNIIKTYGNKVRLISERDSGIYDACNKGLLYSNGLFVNILMAGDFHDSNFLISNYNLLKGDNYDFIYGGVTAIDKSRKQIMRLPMPINKLEDINGMPFAHPTLLVKNSIAKNLKFSLNYKYASDLDFVCRLYKNGYRGKNTNLVLTYYTFGGVGNNFISLFESYNILNKYKLLKLNSLIILTKQIILTIWILLNNIK